MRKIQILMILFIVSINYSYSKDFKEYLKEANEYKLESRYSKAIRFYTKAIKNDKNNQLDVKKVYFEIADCFLKQGKYRMAIRVMRSSIYNYGATVEDIASSEILEEGFKKTALREIEPNYNKYRKKYIARLDNIDEYLEKESIVLR